MKYNIYKYCRKNLYKEMFKENGTFSLKFSNLKNFNDPYEYFLTIDYNIPEEQLAMYNDMINMHLTYLATCFSKTPINTPMWAHYSDDFQGYLIEINEEVLIDYFNEIKLATTFNDIIYKDTPSSYLNEKLAYATIRCKFRDIYQFEKAVIYYAYFVKQKCWKYEQERRLIIAENYFESDSQNLLWCPINLINSIVVGYNASKELKLYLKNISYKYNINYYEIYPSKISLQPFFLDEYKNSYKFSPKTGIKKVKYFCPKCNEPIKKNQKLCSWCSITKTDRLEARYKNAYRILDQCGLLDSYIQQMDEITEAMYRKEDI